MAWWTPNADPLPVRVEACESSVSLAGERTAFPSRSVAYNSSAGATAVVTPISGTLSTVRAYPTIVQVQ